MDKPVCAVWVVTYNQKNFIAQTIESIVQQKTNFRFKVYIGDDCSTDGTREICIKYKNLYPELIELVFNSVNYMQQNSMNVYNACFNSGAKYTAMCEGDDYWSDSYKLQTQVDFLESHSEFSGCFHNTEERFEDDINKSSFLYCNFPNARAISFNDLCYANIIPTCSVIFKNNLFDKFPEWYFELRLGDWTLHLLNAQFGDFWYIPRIMAVHRLHNKSTWMLQDADKNRQSTIEAYDEMIKGFGFDTKFSDCLKRGKEAFTNSGKPVVSNGFKDKAKHVIIKIIDKL